MRGSRFDGSCCLSRWSQPDPCSCGLDCRLALMADDVRTRLRAIPSLTGTAPGPRHGNLPDEPVSMFLEWLDEALVAKVPEPHAMTLATVDSQGFPDARVLILKDVDERGWAFAGLASSRKGQQLDDRAAAALTFWWQPVARSVRVRGEVVKASRQESVADLRARSLIAQQGVDPDDWTLWWVNPSRVEFWQGSQDRDHHRLVYTRDVGPDGAVWRVSQT